MPSAFKNIVLLLNMCGLFSCHYSLKGHSITTIYKTFTFFAFFFFFWEGVLLCSLAWPGTWDPPASVSWALELQVCITMFNHNIYTILVILSHLEIRQSIWGDVYTQILHHFMWGTWMSMGFVSPGRTSPLRIWQDGYSWLGV
jgi:hypothetical protein